MKTLKDIVESHRSLDEIMIENGGELADIQQEEIVDNWMREILSDLSEKADGYKYRQDTLNNASETLKARAKIISNAAKVLDNMSDNLKYKMKFAMIEMGKDTIEGNDFQFKLGKARSRLVLDPEVLSQYYKTLVTSIEIDKKKIAEDLENGIVIEGARLEPAFTLRTVANKKVKEIK